jgi:hypothetical protein
VTRGVVLGELGQCMAVSAEGDDVVGEAARVEREQVGGSSLLSGGCEPLGGAGDAVGVRAVLELQDVDDPIGRAGLEVVLQRLQSRLHGEEGPERHGRAALIVRQGSPTMNEGVSSRSAGSPRRVYQVHRTVATAWAGAWGPE